MEEQKTDQNLHSNPETSLNQTSSQTPHHEHSKKKLILAIFGVIILLVVFSGGFYYMGMNKNNSSKYTSNTTTQTVTSPIPTEASSSAVTGKNLVPITENTVSYGYQGNKLLMNYRDKVYSDTDSDNGFDEPEPASKYQNVTWYGLIDSPYGSNIIGSKIDPYDGVFDFAPLSGGNFVLVMRWALSKGDEFEETRTIYYFNSSEQKLSELASYKGAAPANTYTFPIFNSASPDGKNLAFNMFGCWNCGGHYPQIRLFNIDTKANKNLSQVLDFKWTGNNAYSYKEYKEIECSEPQPGPCLEDTENLPLKTGTFN